MDFASREIAFHLKRNLLFPKFIKKTGLDAELIKAHLEQEDVIRKASQALKDKEFDAKSVYGIFTDLFEDLGVRDADTFLTDVYKFSTNLNFKDVEVIETESKEDFESAARLFLKIMSIFDDYQRHGDDGTWMSRYPMNFLSAVEEDVLEPSSKLEYQRFKKAFNRDHVYEMMKLSQDVKGYTTLEHVCGVHHLAVKIAKQLKILNFPLDLGRVSGAAMGHDIGKYGCKMGERHRVAYFHYYYTGEWFKEREIIYIRNIAINHSTWDLELENLPIEALILIYADFRVKADDTGLMRFWTLKDSFEVILDKLDNVDEAKEKRYKKVYDKLKDFEDYMHYLGINTDPDSNLDVQEGHRENKKYFSLLQGDEIIDHTKFVSIRHSIKMMHQLRDEDSLGKMLESARDVSNQIGLRGYINLLEEYTIYLTQKQKQITVNFLYDRLISPEEDIRKLCAMLTGYIIGNYDEELRKELPEGAHTDESDLTSLKMFALFSDKILSPDQKIIGKHKQWIQRSFSSFIEGYFTTQKNPEKLQLAYEQLAQLYVDEIDEMRYERELLDTILALPLTNMERHFQNSLIDFLDFKLVSSNLNCRLHAIDILNKLVKRQGKAYMNRFGYADRLLDQLDNCEHTYERFGLLKIMEKLTGSFDYTSKVRGHLMNIGDISDIYLSNLKAATPDIVKKIQIQILLRYSTEVEDHNSFYTAMHFCNLLKVSSMESVRNSAGEGLIRIAPFLSFEQRNDIVVELLRALEMESFQVTRYIPDYLGRIILYVKPEEFIEIIEEFKTKVKKSNTQTGMLILKTVGVAIRHFKVYKSLSGDTQKGADDIFKTLLGVLLNGFVNYNPSITQAAFFVLGKDLFASDMSFADKKRIYEMTGKKMLTLAAITDEEDELVFLHNSVGMKNIYKFISDYQSEVGPLQIQRAENIAFFPGTFDPFSLSHKEIAREIRDLGFEVYLAVDEFSWSKRTQPNLIRRNIIKMSVADELDIYTYPRDLVVNIANNDDLNALKESFGGSEVFIVVGSDVIVNASAYKKLDNNCIIREFPHIVFERRMDVPGGEEVESDKVIEAIGQLNPKSIHLFLAPQFELISSTQIRNYIDDNRDISELVDPLAQRYIYHGGLYQREPQFKEKLVVKSVNVEIIDEINSSILEEISLIEKNVDFSETYHKLKDASKKLNFRLLIVRSTGENRRIIGFGAFHWLRASNIYREFEDEYLENYLRDNSVGRIIVIDGVYAHQDTDMNNVEQIVLTETLAYSVARDYSYAIYKDCVRDRVTPKIDEVLKYSGFVQIKGQSTGEEVYVVNMSNPCTLNLDLKSAIKEPFRNTPAMLTAIAKSREALQNAITKLYPGQLVLNFDRTMLYENLIKKICDENNVPTVNLEPRVTGDAMCVPFGAILKRWILPNTVTKSIHVEKYFKPDLSGYAIEAYPHYLNIDNQIKILKSFNRPVMFVDDILDKGYRIKEVEPVLRAHAIEIRKMFVGILSGRGKALMEMRNIEVDSAYFLPRLKVWFNESKLYPFIGGDGVIQHEGGDKNLLSSINLILPYAYPSYIKGATKQSIYELSSCCLENALRILEVLEDEYQTANDRILTLAQLGEVLISPRHPDKGDALKYDMGRKASECIRQELEQLYRLKYMFDGR